MPAASVEVICNMALGFAGVSSRITSLAESSASARACSTYYEQYRDDLLEEYEWTFSVRRVLLSPYTGVPFDVAHVYALADPVQYGSNIYRSLQGVNVGNIPNVSPAWWQQMTRDGWGYAAPIPDDVLSVVEIYPKPDSSSGVAGASFPVLRADQRIPYSIEDANDGSGGRIILMNVPNPVLKYKARITNTASFPAGFIKALAWRLSSPLCLIIRADPKAAQLLEVKAERETSKQIVKDLKQRQQPPEPVSEFEAARED